MLDRVLVWWLMFQNERQRAQGLVEYALILVLISLAAIAAMGPLGTQIAATFGAATTQLGGAAPGGAPAAP